MFLKKIVKRLFTQRKHKEKDAYLHLIDGIILFALNIEPVEKFCDVRRTLQKNGTRQVFCSHKVP